MLDPAGGSGHFLLYSFDLLETIYLEAWEDRLSPESDLTGKRLCEDFPDVAQLRKEIPRLILEHNLHGIDIDPRAVQIASARALDARPASWQEIGSNPLTGLGSPGRTSCAPSPCPARRTCAVSSLTASCPVCLGQLVETVFDKMKLAGEAGSLLKIEDEIRDAVDKAKKQWQEGANPGAALYSRVRSTAEAVGDALRCERDHRRAVLGTGGGPHSGSA